jgi:replicative DNA helicase
MEIMTVTPTAANWEAYAEILHDEAMLKRLQEAAGKILCAADLDTAREATQQAVSMLADKPGLRCISFSQGLLEFIERQQANKKPNYIKWGINFLDDVLYAEPGDFVIIGGRPSSGKTVLAAQFAFHMAASMRVGIFSLETRDRKIYDRLISYVARVPFEKVKRHTMESEDFKKAVELGRIADKINLDVIDAAGMSVDDIQAISLSRHYDIIFIDYVQLLKGEGKTRVDQVANISIGLHTMAGQTGITVVALAQLSRPDKSQKNTPPKMSDLKESGQLEQDADVIMMLYLDDDDMPDGDRLLKIEKNKEGERGFFRLGFYPKYISFYPKGKTYDFQNKPTAHFSPVTKEEAQMELPFKEASHG